ncbi:MAG: LPS assembly protein LptD [Magnetospirillum sp.]|nr:LPS assembly protein LptD [Magnetospirillum sp.]
MAATPADTGSWGQAWGDESVPEAPQPAPGPRAAVPTAASTQPPTAGATRAVPAPAGPAVTEIGGWGNAWGDEAPAAAPASRTSAAAPISSAPVPPPAAAIPAGPSPNEINAGWSDAWDGPAAPPATPAAPPRRTAESPPGPIRIQAPAPTATPPEKAKAPSGTDRPSSGDDALPADTERPVSLTADQIVYDRELGIVSAKGRVEIVQQGRALVADQVSYNLKQDIVSASGNVIMAEPTGETLFTNYVELTGDLKEGVAGEIRAILADNSRMAAASAHRVAGNRTDFDKGVYTACEPCRNQPDKTPIWQAKAERITHNQDERTIEYRDAWIELGGVPVIYTPYLSHPDPTVRRQSGFLMPTPGMSSNIGTNVTVPYFWAIKDNQDITFMPRFLFPSAGAKEVNDLEESDSALRRLVLAGEHRWRGTQGEARTFASLTGDRHNGDLRGHIDPRARFDLDNNWRAGYQLERASDDTYLSVYSYPIQAERPWLTTRPYVEGFSRRSYMVAEGFAYQGLRETDDPGNSPIVLPHVSTSHISTPDSKGGYYTFDNDMLAYARSDGPGATRLSTTAGWHRPYYGGLGDVTTISTSLRADGYHADDVPNVGSANTGRVVPQVAANWRMPFARASSSLPQVIEPMAMIAASPNGGNSEKIPNEDSIGFELDETNVFRPNRLPGLDRVEGGLRGAYGLRWLAYPGNSGTVTAVLAQGWRMRDDSTFRQGTGFDEELSDYLARLDIVPSSNLGLYNRARFDRESGELRRTQNSLVVGSPILQTSLSYLMFERSDDEIDPFPRQHYLALGLSSALTRYWSFQGGISYDLTDMGGPIAWTTRLAYDDECFAFITDMRRNYTYDRDYLSGYSLTFNVVFKTLSGIPFNVF